MQIPNDFFTVSSFGTLAGSSTAVYLVTGVIGYLMNYQTSQNVKKWVGLVLSFMVAFIAASLIEDKSNYTWIVAIFNGFLIYATATGINTMFSARGNAETASSASKQMAKVMNKNGKISNSGIVKAKGKFTDRWW